MAARAEKNEAIKENGTVKENMEAGGREASGDTRDLVKFRLFKDNDKYSAPVFVGVNGVGYLVKRGEEVEMPRSVYEVLKNSEDQASEAGKIMKEAEYSE